MAGTTTVCFSGSFEMLKRGGWHLPSFPESSCLEQITYERCQVPSARNERPNRVLLFCILGCVGFLYSNP